MADYFPLIIDSGLIQELQSGDSIDIASITQSGIDHGSISGLGDDDHSIYHTDGRAATWLAANHETTYNHANYDTAYGWGDHSIEGYLTAESDTLDDVTGRGSTTANAITVGSTLTLSSGSITDSGGTINFGASNISNVGRLSLGGTAYSNVAATIGGTITSANHSFGTYMGNLTLTPAAGWNAFFSYYGGGHVSTSVGNIYGIYVEVLQSVGTYQKSYSIYAKKMASSGTTADYGAYIEGDVGIGTNAPTEKLHVTGNILSSGTITASTVIATGLNNKFGGGSSNPLGASVSSILYGTTGSNFPGFVIVDLSAAAMSGYFILDQSSNGVIMGTYSNHDFSIRTNNIDRIEIEANGNIKTKLDNQKLFFGASQDVSTYFDGSDWIFNSETITANDEIHFTNFDRITTDSYFKGSYESSDGSAGVSGSWTAGSGETITVKDGLITGIV